MFRSLLAMIATLTLGMGSAAAAQGTLYICKVTQTSGPSGWIVEDLALLVQADGSGAVADSLLITYMDGVEPAQLRQRGDNLLFNWNLSGAVDDAQLMIPTFAYRATLNPASGAVKVSAKPARFNQRVNGQGTCRAERGVTAAELKRRIEG